MSDNEQGAETFLSHLVELRNRLLWSIVAVVVVFLCLVPWSKDIYALISQPMLAQLPTGGRMIATEITSPFFIPFKVTLLAAVVIALPFLLYQALGIRRAGLYAAREATGRAADRLPAPLLFFCGMAFAYFRCFRWCFDVMQTFAPEGVEWMPDIGTYLSFVMTMFIAFGVTFEVPVAVVILVRMGMVTVAKLQEIRPYVIVGAFVIAAVVTPPDVISQILLAVPLCLLYEVGHSGRVSSGAGRTRRTTDASSRRNRRGARCPGARLLLPAPGVLGLGRLPTVSFDLHLGARCAAFSGRGFPGSAAATRFSMADESDTGLPPPRPECLPA